MRIQLARPWTCTLAYAVAISEEMDGMTSHTGTGVVVVVGTLSALGGKALPPALRSFWRQSLSLPSFGNVTTSAAPLRTQQPAQQPHISRATSKFKSKAR